MRLRRQLLLLLYSAALAAVLAGTLAVYLVVMPSFLELEDGSVRSDVKRVEAAFMQKLTTLHARSRDFAERDMVIAYAAGEREAPPAAPGQGMDSPPLDLVLVLGEDGQVTPLTDAQQLDTQSIGALYQTFVERSCYSFWGVTLIGESPYLFSIDQVGDCAAVLLAERMDQSMAMEVTGLTGFPVMLERDAAGTGRAIQINQRDARKVEASFPIRDYLGEPLMAARVTLDRPLAQSGLAIMLTVAAVLLLVALVAVGLVHRRFSELVFARLRRLHETVRRIAAGGSLERVYVPGDDELGQLARDFNSMVDNIVTAQQSLEAASEQAEAASRAKNLFLANMSHEIRTPMTAILGYAELLENRYLTDEERERYLGIIQQNGDALMALISDVLDLSRIEAGQLKVEHQRFDLPSLMKDVLYSHALRAREQDVALELHYRTAVPRWISTDPFRLRQILVNLVGNALKFTDHGMVTVAVSWEDGLQSCLHIEVRDSGIGIAPEALDRLFEPFSQVDPSHTRRHGGSGLGLAIARQLARSMGGDIEVESEPGQGSVFSVTIRALVEGDVPRVMPDQALEVEMPSQRQPVVMVGGRVLLVEDNRVNRMLVQRILVQGQMQVVEAENGEQALDCLDREPDFDLVIMDMQMPVMDGYVAAGRMRSQGFGGPILALTANVMAEDRGRCLDAGCDEFLGKPVRAGQLLATCARLIRQAR